MLILPKMCFWRRGFNETALGTGPLRPSTQTVFKLCIMIVRTLKMCTRAEFGDVLLFFFRIKFTYVIGSIIEYCVKQMKGFSNYGLAL